MDFTVFGGEPRSHRTHSLNRDDHHRENIKQTNYNILLKHEYVSIYIYNNRFSYHTRTDTLDYMMGYTPYSGDCFVDRREGEEGGGNSAKRERYIDK